MYNLTFSDDEALVLFELLVKRSDHWLEDGFDEAEQLVLWRVEGQLESALVQIFAPNYRELLEQAKKRLVG